MTTVDKYTDLAQAYISRNLKRNLCVHSTKRNFGEICAYDAFSARGPCAMSALRALALLAPVSVTSGTAFDHTDVDAFDGGRAALLEEPRQGLSNVST